MRGSAQRRDADVESPPQVRDDYAFNKCDDRAVTDASAFDDVGAFAGEKNKFYIVGGANLVGRAMLLAFHVPLHA